MAARPRTLPAAIAPVLVGTAAAAYEAGELPRLGAFIGALVGSIFIQIGTNLANDYHDFRNGADGADRLGPARASQQGWLDPAAVLAGALVCFGAAIVFGLYLVLVGGWPVVAIGLVFYRRTLD